MLQALQTAGRAAPAAAGSEALAACAASARAAGPLGSSRIGTNRVDLLGSSDRVKTTPPWSTHGRRRRTTAQDGNTRASGEAPSAH